MNQVSRNAKHLLKKGLVPFSALVRPAAKELFTEIRQCNHITAAELFDQMLEMYQQQSVIILQDDKPEPEPVIILQDDKPEPEPVIILQDDKPEANTADAINLVDMTTSG
jgi:hypothetical protein